MYSDHTNFWQSVFEVCHSVIFSPPGVILAVVSLVILWTFWTEGNRHK